MFELEWGILDGIVLQLSTYQITGDIECSMRLHLLSQTLRWDSPLVQKSVVLETKLYKKRLCNSLLFPVIHNFVSARNFQGNPRYKTCQKEGFHPASVSTAYIWDKISLFQKQKRRTTYCQACCYCPFKRRDEIHLVDVRYYSVSFFVQWTFS
jgi:hypothetical protein